MTGEEENEEEKEEEEGKEEDWEEEEEEEEEEFPMRCSPFLDASQVCWGLRLSPSPTSLLSALQQDHDVWHQMSQGKRETKASASGKAYGRN